MRIPLWLKIGYTVWLVGWMAHYVHGHYTYGASYSLLVMLWFCYIGNFLVTVGLWTESRLLFSWQTVALLLVQLAFSIDVLSRLLLGWHVIGGTEYMFDPNVSLSHRILSLFHVPMPVFLLWGVWRLGYDRRAFLSQSAECVVLLPLTYFLTQPRENVNWVYGPFEHAQHVVPTGIYLVFCMVVYPLAIYLPTHLLLAAFFPARPRGLARTEKEEEREKT
jgi:hypothetical protein